MADPFAEFEQVGEAQAVATPDILVEIEDQPVSTSTSTSASTFNPNNYASDFQSIAEDHYQKRRKYEDRVQAKMNEINQTIERLYNTRYDESVDKQQTLANTKAELVKLNILNEEISEIRKKQMAILQDQLNLDDIGLGKRIRTSSFRKNSSVNYHEGGVEDSLLEPESGFSRTQSTNTLKDKSAEEKWPALFKMFRAFIGGESAKMYVHLKKPSILSSRTGMEDSGAMVEKEINKLRGAIQQLEQRGIFSKVDENMLMILQAKLRAMIELNKSL